VEVPLENRGIVPLGNTEGFLATAGRVSRFLGKVAL
jgi:hypothetical protein